MKREPIITGEVYHVYNRSIAGFEIFSGRKASLRMKECARYYQFASRSVPFTRYIKVREGETSFLKKEITLSEKDKLAQIIAYCIMPTHVHFALKQLKDEGVSVFMGNIQNSYARYFNIKYNRKGPLWESKFKAKRVDNDEQMLHLTRYIHLNPVTAGIVDDPAGWEASSYEEYLKKNDEKDLICEFSELIDLDPKVYKAFVEDRISYQRELAKIKHLLFD